MWAKGHPKIECMTCTYKVMVKRGKRSVVGFWPLRLYLQRKLNFIHFSCAAGAEKFLGKCKQLLLIL